MNAQEIILEYERRPIDAQRTSNVTELDELLHDALLFTIPNGQVITKQIDLDSHRSGDMKVTSSITLDQIVRLFDDMAIALTTIELKGQYKGQPINGKFIYNRVWKNFAVQWKLIAGSAIQLG